MKNRKLFDDENTVNKDYLIFNNSLLKEFKNYCRGKLTKTTIEGYSNMLKIFFKYTENAEIDRLKKSQIVKIFSWITEDHSIHITRRVKNAVKKYYSFLNDYYEANLDEAILNIQLDRVEIKQQKAMKFNETQELLEKMSKTTAHGFTNLRNMTIFILLATTGMRRKEILNIQLDDIDFETKEIKINITKGERKKRMAYLFPIAEEYLKLYLAEREKKSDGNNYLLITRNGNKMALETIGHIASKTAKKYNINFTLHSFRRGFATDLNKNNVPVHHISKTLGHENASTTLQHYIQFDNSLLKEIYLKHPAKQKDDNCIHFNDIIKILKEQQIKEN